MPAPVHPLLEDDFVASEIDRALAGYADALDADELAWMRDALAEEITGDAELQDLLSVAHPRGADVSGERHRPWLGDVDDANPAGGESALETG